MSTQASEEVLIIYNSRSMGRETVVGSVTKKPLGYRKRGDRFLVPRADMLARPDLFRPVNKEDMPVQEMRRVPRRELRKPAHEPRPAPPQQPVQRTPPQEMPPPPELARKQAPEIGGLDQEIRAIDWGGTLNRSHIKALFQNNVRTLRDAREKGRDGLIGIKGIGEKIADTLLSKADEYA
ncbi:MAG: hypothetical protein ACWGQW_02615 [bacterium]